MLGTRATFLAAYKVGIGDVETANPHRKDDVTIPPTIDAPTRFMMESRRRLHPTTASSTSQETSRALSPPFGQR
jgi:hypothetical protein